MVIVDVELAIEKHYHIIVIKSLIIGIEEGLKSCQGRYMISVPYCDYDSDYYCNHYEDTNNYADYQDII